MIEQTAHYIFSGETVTAFNDRICISYPFTTSFTFSVDGEDLLRTLKTISETNADIAMEGDTLKIKSESVEAELSTVVGNRSAEKMIAGIGIPNLAWTTLPDRFSHGLAICSFTASEDATKRNLTAVHVVGDFMEASDDFRISEYLLDEGVTLPEMLIPKKAAAEIAKFEAKEYSLADAWAHFKTEEGLVFSTRIIKEEYPDCSILFDIQGSPIQLPLELKEIAQGVSFMTEGKTESDVNITLTFSRDHCLVEAKKAKGVLRKRAEMTRGPETPVKISINPNFLIEAMGRSSKVTVGDSKEIEGVGKKSVALFESDNFRHAVALVLR